jgi:Fe2+ transport system protein FeoA
VPNNHSHRQTLADIKTGEHVTFINIQAEKAVASRLTSLGFTPGVDIVMTQNYGRGPLLVNLRGTRVALGRHEAQNITVQKGLGQ